MDNYEEQTKVSLKNSEVEISTKKIIPLSDFLLISEICKNGHPINYCIETSNKKQFENIKSVFKGYIPYNEYIKILSSFDSIIENAKINNNIFYNEQISDYTTIDILGLFLHPLIELVIDNKIIDGIYSYSILDEYDLRTIISTLNIEKGKSFISLYSIFNIIHLYQNNGFAALNAYKSIITDKDKNNKLKRTYIMQDVTGYYKIGRSIDPIFRQYQFKTGNITIKLMFYIEGDRELELHHIFASKKIDREWYKLTKNDLKFIRNYNNIRKQHPEYIINKK